MNHQQKKNWPMHLCLGVAAVCVLALGVIGVALALREARLSGWVDYVIVSALIVSLSGATLGTVLTMVSFAVNYTGDLG